MKAVFGMTDTTTTPVNKRRKNLGRRIIDQQRQQHTKTKQKWFDVQVSIERTRHHHHHKQQQHGSSHPSRGRRVVTQRTHAHARNDRLTANDDSNCNLNSNNVLSIKNSQSDLDDDDNESIDSTSSVIHVSSSEHNFYDDDDDDNKSNSQRKQDKFGDEDDRRNSTNDDYDSDDSTTTSSTTTPFMNCLLRVDQQRKEEPSPLTQILSFSPSKKFSSSLSTSSSVNDNGGGGGGGGGAIISITRKSLNQQRRMFDDYNRSKTLEGTKILPPPLPTPCSFDLPSSTTSGDLIPVENDNNDDDDSSNNKSLIAPQHHKKSRTFDECDGEDILRSTTIKKNRNDATPLIKNTNRYHEDEEEEQQYQSCHSSSTTGTAGALRRRMNGGDANNSSSNGIISKSNSSSVNSLLNILEQDERRSSSNLKDDRETTFSRERRENANHELMEFHLTTSDELHVIPCQCALSLMGMRGTTLLFASPESSSASFGGTYNNNHDNAPLPGVDERETSSSSSGITNTFMGWLFSSSSNTTAKKQDDSLTRTVSGQHHHHYFNGATNSSNNKHHNKGPSQRNNDKKDNELAKLRKRNKQPALFEIDHTDQYPSTMSINALHRTTPSISKKLHKRSFSNTFVSVQYHEIVLFNMSSAEDRGGGNDDDESTTTWNTITIRCEDHDTMDEIVRTLKRASNCKIIPFSTNSRLEEARQLASQQRKQHRRQQRQRQQQQHDEQIRRQRQQQQQQSTPTSTIDGQLQPKCYLPSSLPLKKRENEYSSERLNDDPLRTDLLVPQVGMSVSEDTPISEEENDHFSLEDTIESNDDGSTFLPLIAFTTPKRRLSLLSTSSNRRDRDRRPVLPTKLGSLAATAAGSNKKNWNMAEECEFCGLHFTLLSRRHHCRKCSCSCCEDCSIVVFLSAKEETRLCNRCNSKELVLNTPQRIPGSANTATGRIRQGTALRSGSTSTYTDERGRSQRKQHRKFSDSMTLCLLGKVHEGCSTYGVAVMGMLPHWKHYFHFDKRPAVGRITVEIVEALSLKRIDLNLKCNPYVRATITGYDYDLEHNLVEWQQQFTLMTSYCSSTLSPVWRGPGKMGGQLLTLPVLSTCGAVLRLEVLHFDQITNAAGVDSVIGVVEIPLSDLPNANLRNKDSIINNNTGARRSSSSTTYAEDGFVDRWYHLEEPLPPVQVPPSSTTNPSSSTATTASGIFEPDTSRDRILSSATSHRMSAYLAKPVSNPLVQPQQQHATKKGPTATSTTTTASNQTMEEGFKSNPIVKKWLRTMDEVNQWGENAIKVPMEWIGAALVGLDPSNKSKTKPNPLTSMTANSNTTTKSTAADTTIGNCTATTDTSTGISSSSHSRKLDSSSGSNKRRSVIHVRVKLNVSETGDLMSHSWFPPMIKPYPKRPTFDPNTTYRRILYILQKADPYIKFLKICEKCLKWKKPTKTCLQFHFLMVFHVFWFHQLIYLVHIYLIGYLSYRYHDMMQQQKQKQRQATRSLDDFVSSTDNNTTIDGSGNMSQAQQQYSNKGSVETNRCYMDGSRSSFTSNLDDDISLRSSSTTASRSGRQQPGTRRDVASGGTTVQETSDDSSSNSAGLNKIIVWAAKKWLSSRGMDSLQYKLGLLASNVTKLNTTWDGSNSRVTAGTIVILTVSFVLHISCNVRYLWMLFITIGYFGPSPLLQKVIRFIIGFYKGCLKVLRRRHLHVLEQQQQH